jgi:hypothetical protein
MSIYFHEAQHVVSTKHSMRFPVMASCTQTILTIIIPLSEWIKKEANPKSPRNTHLNNIKQHICALLNSGGGALILRAQADENVLAKSGLRSDDIIRAIEQAFHPVIKTRGLSSHLTTINETPAKIVLKVEGLKSLCTLNYNMFLPTNTQVLPIDELDTAVALMNVNRLVDVTDFKNANPIDQFILDSVLSIKESKIVQFKCLKSDKSKHNDLARRIIKNKLACYVSAFANNIGGRIYIGIDDKTGRVVGEIITEAEQKDLEMEIQKQIDKMLWPEYCTPPVKGKEWDISFHTVTDSDGYPVDTKVSEGGLSVIVITIYACLGGVFVKEPEGYHIVQVKAEESESSEILENKVQRMNFSEWKTKLLYPDGERDIPRTLSTCDWSSRKLKKQCDLLDGELLRLINYGEWKDFEREAEQQRPKANDPNRIEIELVLLSKWYVYHYRRGEKGDFESADKLMVEFNEKFSKSKESLIFQIRGRLCLSALQRTRGDHEGSYRTAKDCLSNVEMLSPCILTVEFYVHFATMLSIIEGNEVLREKLKGDLSQTSFKEEAMKFYNRALEHLRKIDYVPRSKADMEQKSLINMAILTLGCSLSGDVVDEVVSKEALDVAITCLERVEKSRFKDANPLSGFRLCHYKFAVSSLHYRRSQYETQINKRIPLLRSAIQVAREVAAEHKFPELSNYACKHVQVYTNELEQLKAMRC